MGELYNFSFDGGDKELIGVVNYGTIWTNNQQKHNLSLTKTSLKISVNYLLDNYYFTFSITCFCQLTLSIMGSDRASFMSNLF